MRSSGSGYWPAPAVVGDGRTGAEASVDSRFWDAVEREDLNHSPTLELDGQVLGRVPALSSWRRQRMEQIAVDRGGTG